jgi:AcrR family transcriptional regulator
MSLDSTTKRQRADGLRTRQTILVEAVSLASVEGLEGISIGGLAKALGISKSGLYAHFGSKEELQLAVIDEAGKMFFHDVIEPASKFAPGLPRLGGICEAFFDYLERRVLPGGCFFAGAVLEMGSRPGPVKEKVAAFQTMFVGLIRESAEQAISSGQLDADEEPDLLAFELTGMILAADANFVMTDDVASLNTARRALRRRLGIAD